MRVQNCSNLAFVSRIARPLAALALIAAVGGAAVAQVAPTQVAHKPEPASKAPATDDEAAIRAGAKRYEEAFNRGDAKALAAFWTEDGEFVDESGQTFVGRAAIEKKFTEILAKQPDAKITIDVNSVKPLSADVVLEQGTTRSTVPTGPSGTPVHYTAVNVNRNGQWLLLNVTESRPSMPSSATLLAPLDWMVGEWKAEFDNDKAYRMTCRWLPEGTFLQRTFTVSQGQETLSSGTQIIGWSPVLGQIVSWTFDSTGGFGHEMWEEQGDLWRIFTTSVLPDGSTSSSENEMQKTGDDSFTWRSVGRSLNGKTLPDTVEVRVERVSQ